jgi:hypothetical protein
MALILAFSIQDQVEKFGAYVGLAAFLGLAVLSLLYFAQARELKRLRDWAGRAPERAQELEARVVAQAEEALRDADAEPAVERSGTVGPAVPVAKPSGNGRQAGRPAPIPMGPRPATAMAAAAASAEAAQATAEAPAVEEERAAGDEGAAAADEDRAAAPDDDDRAVAANDDRAAAANDDRAAAAATGGAGVVAGGGKDPAAEDEAAAEDRPAEPVGSGNGVPAEPPTQIPRATPRPQPRPAPAAAPLRATQPSRAATLPPRRTRRQQREGGSRAGLYTVLGIVVLLIAIAIPVYFMVLSGDDEGPPQGNQVADPGASPTVEGGAGQSAADARPEKVVVVLNGTPTDGLASGERDKLVAAGYSDEQGMLRIDNNADQQCQDSVVYYTPGAEGRRQARDVSRLLDITRTEQIDEETQALADSSDESGTQPADVVALLCADKSP